MRRTGCRHERLRARPAPVQCALGPRQCATYRSRLPAGSQQRHRQHATPHRNTAVVLNIVQPARFWWSQLQIPLAIFVVTATVFALTPLDEHIARAVFFDSAHAQWIGGRSWVINEMLHTGGRWAIRVIVAIALAF